MLFLKYGICCCNLVLFSVSCAGELPKILRTIYFLIWSAANFYYFNYFPNSIEFYLTELTFESLSKFTLYLFWGLTIFMILYILCTSSDTGRFKASTDDFLTLIFYQNLFILYKYPIFSGYYNTFMRCLPVILMLMYSYRHYYSKDSVLSSIALLVIGILIEYLTVCYSTADLWNFIISLVLPGVGYALIFSMSAGFCELIYYISKKIENESYSIFFKSSRSKITVLFFQEIFKISLIIVCMVGLYFSEITFEYFTGYKPIIASIIIRMAYSYPLALCISYYNFRGATPNKHDMIALNLVAVFFCISSYRAFLAFYS